MRQHALMRILLAPPPREIRTDKSRQSCNCEHAQEKKCHSRPCVLNPSRTSSGTNWNRHQGQYFSLFCPKRMQRSVSFLPPQILHAGCQTAHLSKMRAHACCELALKDARNVGDRRPFSVD